MQLVLDRQPRSQAIQPEVDLKRVGRCFEVLADDVWGTVSIQVCNSGIVGSNVGNDVLYPASPKGVGVFENADLIGVAACVHLGGKNVEIPVGVEVSERQRVNPFVSLGTP